MTNHPSLRKFHRLLPIMLAVLLVTPATWAEDTEGRKSEKAKGREPKDSELGDQMDRMNASFRKLRRQVADPKQNAASLALVDKFRKATAGAAKMLPEKISKLPASEQAAATASYRDQMKELLATIDELSAALKAGNNSEATKVMEDLAELQKAGHREFRPKGEKEKSKD